MVAQFYGKIISRDRAAEYSHFSLDGVSIHGLVKGAEQFNMKALPINISFESLRDQAPLPCIAYWQQRHFIVVYDVTDKKVEIADPAIGLMTYKKEDFLNGWLGKKASMDSEGTLVLLEPSTEFYTDLDGLASSDRKIHSKRRLGFLLPYLRPYKSGWVRLILGLIVATAIQLIIPFLTKSVVDFGINYQDINFIYILLIAQLALFVSRVSVEIIRDWLLLHIGSRISITILSDFLIKLLRLPVNFFESRMIGDILQRIQDHQRLQQFLSEQSLTMLFSVFNLVVFGFVLALFDGWIFLVYMLGTIFYILWVLIFMKKREKVDYMRFDQLSASQSSNLQIIQGMSEIKINSSERRRRWEWEETQAKYYKVEMKNLSLHHVQRTGGMFISELKNIIITFISAKAVIDGQISLGTMLSTQYIIGQLNAPIRGFIDFILGYQNAMISLDRISEIHDKVDEDENPNKNNPPESGLITFNNIFFKYKGTSDSFVLKGLNFSIPNGKVTAIVGTSGSGKTTLLKLLLKFYKPQQGSIQIGNFNLDNINTSEWRRNCGVVMQDGYIFTDTLLRNITESDSESPVDKSRLAEALRIANLEEFIESLPSGLNTLISNQGSNLSGGQRQRLLMARAIYKNSRVLIFDEATSSLDANNEKIIMANLEKYYKEKTVIIIAHRLSTVKNADNIIVLENGVIVEQGKHLELVNCKGKYYTLVKNQLELGT
jgi:ATP-binding cassette subfamily B protein